MCYLLDYILVPTLPTRTLIPIHYPYLIECSSPLSHTYQEIPSTGLYKIPWFQRQHGLRYIFQLLPETLKAEMKAFFRATYADAFDLADLQHVVDATFETEAGRDEAWSFVLEKFWSEGEKPTGPTGWVLGGRTCWVEEIDLREATDEEKQARKAELVLLKTMLTAPASEAEGEKGSGDADADDMEMDYESGSEDGEVVPVVKKKMTIAEALKARFPPKESGVQKKEKKKSAGPELFRGATVSMLVDEENTGRAQQHELYPQQRLSSGLKPEPRVGFTAPGSELGQHLRSGLYQLNCRGSFEIDAKGIFWP